MGGEQISTKKITNRGTNFGRVRYWSYRFPINIRGVERPGPSTPLIPGPIGRIPDLVGPAEVSPFLMKIILKCPTDPL